MSNSEYDFSEQIKPRLVNGSFHRINAEDGAVKFSVALVKGIRNKIKKIGKGNFKQVMRVFESAFRSFTPTEKCSKTQWALAKINQYLASDSFGLKYDIDIITRSVSSEIDIIGNVSGEEIDAAGSELAGWGIINAKDFISYDDLYLDINDRASGSMYLMSQV